MPNKTQRFSIDLERNEAVAKVAADVEPGDKLDATVSVVSKDEKTLVVELEELEAPDGTSTEDEDDEDEEETSADDEQSPAMRVLGAD